MNHNKCCLALIKKWCTGENDVESVPKPCLITREMWRENICHIQTVTQEIDGDNAARICLGSCTGSVHKSNLSQCGAWSQWLTSLLFSDSLQIVQASRKQIRYTKSKYRTIPVLSGTELQLDSIIILKTQEGMCLPCVFPAIWTWCYLLDKRLSWRYCIMYDVMSKSHYC